MPVPVWAALLAVAVAKKVVVFTAAKIYGFPRLYRKSQQLARWTIRDKATLKLVSGRIGYLYRAPNTLSARLFGPNVHRCSEIPSTALRPLQEIKTTQTNVFLKPSFASSTIKRSAPTSCSKSLLASTLHSGQQFFQQRGCSVPKLATLSAMRPVNVAVSTPAAASALRKLGRPFNFVMGHSFGEMA